MALTLLIPAFVAIGWSQSQGSAADPYERGMSLAARGDLEGAVAPLAMACGRTPTTADACYFHGRNLFVLGRYDEAIEPFRKALGAASVSTRWRVHRATAMNFQALGRAREAEDHYENAMRLSADSGIRIDYGAFLYRQGRTREALKPLQAAVEAGESARAHGELGRVLIQLDLVTEAARHLEKAVALSPKDWTFRLLLGKAYLRLGRADEGERELQLARQGLAVSSTSR